MRENYLKIFDRHIAPYLGSEHHEESTAKKHTSYPAVDTWLKDEEYHFMVDLPGVTKDRLNLKIEDNYIKIDASVNPEDKELKAIHIESHDHDFSRMLKVPANADTKKIKASLEDGVLKLTLPLSEANKPKKIEVI